MYDDDDITQEQLLALLGSPSAESQGERNTDAVSDANGQWKNILGGGRDAGMIFVKTLFRQFGKDVLR